MNNQDPINDEALRRATSTQIELMRDRDRIELMQDRIAELEAKVNDLTSRFVRLVKLIAREVGQEDQIL